MAAIISNINLTAVGDDLFLWSTTLKINIENHPHIISYT